MAQRLSSNCNVRLWRSEIPHAIYEHERDSSTVNLFCAVSSSNMFGPFFFAEKTVTGFVYLDMLQIYLMAILKVTMPDNIFQQDGAPCHFQNEVTSYLNDEVPIWIGSGGVIPWPARSPDLTLLDFNVWGFVKDQVYHPPLSKTIPELKSRIIPALGLIDVNMLANIWQELIYRWDISREGSYIAHL
ncbi:hypothetical protein AVEN_191085-1 [Araneus ventricosus]|uniref:Tc1-like transposase DDE domain-containing protein n=1 Tax=Araneus ventricosus TaxID=182803 RepID=A0A4Y2B0K9_ARAVE|nr:hypothetical protein AVEN_191085-1 [Araneus ventricosus]